MRSALYILLQSDGAASLLITLQKAVITDVPSSHEMFDLSKFKLLLIYEELWKMNGEFFPLKPTHFLSTKVAVTS